MSEPQQGAPGVPVPPVDGPVPVPPPAYVPPQPQPHWGGPSAPPPAAPWSVLAIVGFVVAFFVSLVGLVVSILGLRDTRLTGKRGRGLAIAGIVVGAVRFAIDVVLVVALVLAWSSFSSRGAAPVAAHGGGTTKGITSDEAEFGRADDLPFDRLPQGGYQGLTSLGWKSEGGSPSKAVIAPFGNRPTPGYTNAANSCFAEVGVYTADAGTGSEYVKSVDLLKSWLDSSKITPTASGFGTTVSPSFRADAPQAGPDGQYAVVRAPLTYPDGTLGEARARVFSRGGQSIGVVTSMLCQDDLSMSATGRDAIGTYLGAAW